MQYWRDIQKLKLCNENGIKMITIPYWWNGDAEDLKATLGKARNCFPPFIFNSPHLLSIAQDYSRKFLENPFRFDISYICQ
jgi:hypothetical protein